jgi:hypothetical protein
MPRKFLGLILFAVFAVFTVVTVQAQETGVTLRAKIPFDFTVRGKVLPAGTYEITEVSPEADALMISNVVHRRQHVLIDTAPADLKVAPKQSELVFKRFGDDYFLADVFDAYDPLGLSVPSSRQERTLERESAANGLAAPPETVAITLN